MIAARQIAFGKAAGAAKPYKARLEYIESSGTQWIDTGVNGNARWVITAQATRELGSSQVLITSQTSAGGGSWFGEFISNRKWGFGSGEGLTSLSPTVKITADLTFNSHGVAGAVNGISISRSISVSQTRWTICAASEFGGRYFFYGKIWGASCYQDNTLVRSFIPVLDNSDVACVYDEVSGEFFYNVGTGEFIAGPDYEGGGSN